MPQEAELAIKLASQVKAIIFDVDGVLTDGGLYRTDDGQETKRFHSADGLGIRMLGDAGIKIAVITGRESNVVRHRCKELRIEHLMQGAKDKLPAFESLCAEMNLEAKDFAYMGDDIIDWPVMSRVGLALTVPNANAEVAEIAHWQSQRSGGNGAAREACELILKSQNLYQSAVARYMI